MRQKLVGGSKAGGLPHPSFPSPPPFHSPYILSLPVGGKVRSSEGEVPRLPPPPTERQRSCAAVCEVVHSQSDLERGAGHDSLVRRLKHHRHTGQSRDDDHHPVQVRHQTQQLTKYHTRTHTHTTRSHLVLRPNALAQQQMNKTLRETQTLRAGCSKTTAVGSGPVGPVLAGPIIFKVSNDRRSNSFTSTVKKIHKTVSTRAAPFGPDMHQIVWRLGLRTDPTGGAYSAPRDLLAGSRSLLLMGGEGREGKGRGGVVLLRGGEVRRGRGGDGRGRGGEWEGERKGGRGWPDQSQTHCYRSEDGAKNFRPAADPLPGGSGRPKFIKWRWSLPLPTNPVW